MSYEDLLKNGTKKLIESQKEESVAIFLLEYITKKRSSELYACLSEKCPMEIENQFYKLLDKHVIDNIPVQYITNKAYFYGYEFYVNEDVLIPRFETEELVENILYQYDHYFKGQKLDLVDIGTGSGCIGITLAKEEPNLNVCVTDISSKALDVAKKNALDMDTKINFLQGDMLEPLKGKKFDILVSNPPYIPNHEEVMSLVKDNEPNIALFGGEDGMDFYRRILKDCRPLLKEKAIIAFEHGYDKKEAMMSLAKEYFSDCKTIVLKDMQGKDRMTFIFKGLDYND